MKFVMQMPGSGARKFSPILILMLIFAMGVYACVRSGKVKILQEQQGSNVFSNYDFIYEDWAQPKVVQLFMQEKLEQFIHENKTQWERHVALCNWANAQFPPGNPDPYPLSNGLDILKDIRSGKTKGFCGQYAYLLADAMKSLGYFQVRYVELESQNHQFHFNVEVWNDSWQKWVILDPFFNVYYEDVDRIPLSALQLHDLSVQGRGKDVKIHSIEKRNYQPPPEKSIEFYHSFAISLRNDFAGLQAPVSVRDRLRTFLQYKDPRLNRWRSNLAYEQSSSRNEDFDYPCNQVWITYRVKSTNNIVDCTFETKGTVPHFHGFLVSQDGEPWRQSREHYEWKPGAGEHHLDVVATNPFNIFSRPASLKINVSD